MFFVCGCLIYILFQRMLTEKNYRGESVTPFLFDSDSIKNRPWRDQIL